LILYIYLYSSTYAFFYFMKNIQELRITSFHFVEPPDNGNYGRSK